MGVVKITGQAGAGGKGFGRLIYLPDDRIAVEKRQSVDAEEEIGSLLQIQKEYGADLESLYEEALSSLGETCAEIFKAYHMMLDDEAFFGDCVERCRSERLGLDFIIWEQQQATVAMFEEIDDAYMKERAVDIANVCQEVIRRLNGRVRRKMKPAGEPFILAAEDLTPEDVMGLDRRYLCGIITESGGITSHTVILAKAMGVPAVVGAAGIGKAAESEEYVLLDGDEGCAYVGAKAEAGAQRESRVMGYLDQLIARYPVLKKSERDIREAFILIKDAYMRGGKLLIAGNGGSCADSAHIVGELMKSFVKRRRIPWEIREEMTALDAQAGKHLAVSLQGALPAIDLTGNQSLSSAFANDVDGSLGCAQQLYGYGRPEDVFLGISTSGNAENIQYAAITAKALGIKVIGLTGGDGGSLKKIADLTITVPEKETYKVQELHMPVYHTLCLMLEEEFFDI